MTPVVYGCPVCPGCGALTGWLGDHGVAWAARDALADASAVGARFAGAAGGHQAPSRSPAGPGASHG